MKYLDERIVFEIPVSSPYPASGMYKFELYKYTPWNNGSKLIFVGNMYYQTNTTRVKIDMTDIIRSLKEVPSKDKFLDSTTYDDADVSLLHKYKLYVYFSSTPVTTSWQYVSMVYRKPNYKTVDFATDYYDNGDDIYWQAFDINKSKIYTALQGKKVSGNGYVLTPHYPLVNTETYKFTQAFIAGYSLQSYNIKITGDVSDDNIMYYTSQGKEGTLLSIPINTLIDWTETWGTNDLKVYDKNNNLIAIFDNCYKRYYLFWQDRMGGYQSQAFLDKITYSESFDVTETQNYQNERKKASIQVQPKWKLNSGWITEKQYPMYESIFVSPILLLYDAYTDRLYEVMVKGDYTEKTFRSEKKMLNLQLDLEAVSKQNIIY